MTGCDTGQKAIGIAALLRVLLLLLFPGETTLLAELAHGLCRGESPLPPGELSGFETGQRGLCFASHRTCTWREGLG
mgnify:CR=1 FL=1|jgi:hypothetical protein